MKVFVHQVEVEVDFTLKTTAIVEVHSETKEPSDLDKGVALGYVNKFVDDLFKPVEELTDDLADHFKYRMILSGEDRRTKIALK